MPPPRHSPAAPTSYHYATLAIWILGEDQPRGDFTVSLLRRSRLRHARLGTQPTAIRAKLTVIHTTRLPGFTETARSPLRRRSAMCRLSSPRRPRLRCKIHRPGGIQRGSSPEGAPRCEGGAAVLPANEKTDRTSCFQANGMGPPPYPCPASGGSSPRSPLTLRTTLMPLGPLAQEVRDALCAALTPLSEIAVTFGEQVGQDLKFGIVNGSGQAHLTVRAKWPADGTGGEVQARRAEPRVPSRFLAAFHGRGSGERAWPAEGRSPR
ncbi:CU044_2847 family protein [Streptomyces sp. NPDC001840]